MSDPQLLTLALQMLRHLFIDIFEHGRGAWNLAAGKGAVLFGFFLRGDHLGFQFGADGGVFFFGPVANLDQVLLEARDRIAQREVAPVVGRTVLGWIVRGGMRAGAVGDPFDHGRAEVAARAFGGPGRGGVDRVEIVAVDPQRGDAATDATPGEGGGFTTGNRLEGGDGPLVVDHVEDHRRAIHVSESESGVEVRLGGGTVADPGRGDFGLALDRRGHGPAYGLDELGGEVARDGKETGIFDRVHDRQLTSLERIALVRQQLANQVHQRYVAGHQDALLAVGREAHVVDVQGQGLGAADGFFAEALHVERHFFLALGDHHAVVVDPRLEHGTHAFAQDVHRYAFGPRAQGIALVVEHTNQATGQVCRVSRFNVDRGFAHCAGVGQVQVGEVGFAAGATRGFGDVQAQRFVRLVHGFYARSCEFLVVS